MNAELPYFDILLVDDDAVIRTALTDWLRRLGYIVRSAANGREALNELGRGQFALIVTDIFMPEQDGLELIGALRAGSRGTPIVAMSGGGRMQPGCFLRAARLLGAEHTLTKPFDLEQLQRVVSKLLGHELRTERA